MVVSGTQTTVMAATGEQSCLKLTSLTPYDAMRVELYMYVYLGSAFP